MSQTLHLAGVIGDGETARGGAVSERPSHRLFLGVSALLFAASTAVTILWCGSMAAMDGMSMPGGWTMSMTWMLMPGQTRLGAATSFVGMWTVMMIAMMLPCLVPALWRYREAVSGRGEALSGMRLEGLTAIVGLGYFAVWTLQGVAAYLAGLALAAVEMELPAVSRAVPFAIGLVVLIAGALQFTRWKAHHLACCSQGPTRDRRRPLDAAAAWSHGWRLGLHCSYCCAGLTVILLVVGVMDLRAMAMVTAAITCERLAPAGERVAQAVGAVGVAAGLLLIARAAGLG